MAEICEVENKLLRRIIGKLVHLIQVEEDAIGMTLNDEWQRPVFEEAKLYASTVGTDVMTTEANRITELGAELTQARAERDAAREALEKVGIKITGPRNYLAASAKCRPKEKRARAERELAEQLDEVLAAIKAAEGE